MALRGATRTATALTGKQAMTMPTSFYTRRSPMLSGPAATSACQTVGAVTNACMAHEMMGQMAAIGRAFKDGDLLRGEIERCPNCGHTLRIRPGISPAAIKIVADWLAEQEAAQVPSEK
jgi:hypothetical protein